METSGFSFKTCACPPLSGAVLLRGRNLGSGRGLRPIRVIIECSHGSLANAARRVLEQLIRSFHSRQLLDARCEELNMHSIASHRSQSLNWLMHTMPLCFERPGIFSRSQGRASASDTSLPAQAQCCQPGTSSSSRSARTDNIKRQRCSPHPPKIPPTEFLCPPLVHEEGNAGCFVVYEPCIQGQKKTSSRQP